jgi:hypothetical protein
MAQRRTVCAPLLAAVLSSLVAPEVRHSFREVLGSRNDVACGDNGKSGGKRFYPAVRQLQLLRLFEALAKLLENVSTMASSIRRHECFPVQPRRVALDWGRV